MKRAFLCRVGIHAYGERMPAIVPNRAKPSEMRMGWREECTRDRCDAVRLSELFGRAVRS